MSLSVAILAGGLATRLRPLTEWIPKILLDVAGRPFAEHQIDLLRHNGITHVVYCVSHLGERVEAALGDGTRFGMRIEYVFDGPVLLGTGGALRQAVSKLGDRFFVLYGDSYLPCAYGAVEAAFRRSGKAGLMTVFRNDGAWDRSNVVFDGQRIIRYDKRAVSPDMHHIDYGLGILTRRSLEAYPAGSVLDLAAVYQDLLVRGELAGHEVATRFYEIGSPEGLEELRAMLAGGTVEASAPVDVPRQKGCPP